MRVRLLILLVSFGLMHDVVGETSTQMRQKLQRLQAQTAQLHAQLTRLQQQMAKQATTKAKRPAKSAQSSKKASGTATKSSKPAIHYHNSPLQVHSFDSHPESMGFYPTALVADDHVVTYIAGAPVVTSPYLGSLPAFDGSDYIVNISSINRDIRLMQQRRSLYRAYESMGYPAPNMPILALSGKVEPLAVMGDSFVGQTAYDLNLGSGELDIAALLNDKVEGYISLAYDASPPDVGGQRLSNSSVDLNMGFINIGDLDESPFYFTAGQLYVPFGRFSSSMVSAPLTMVMGRTKSRPVILGYKSQQDSGPFAAVFGYRSDTTLDGSGVGGVNLGYAFNGEESTGEIGGSYISSINDAGGMQFTGSIPGTTFGGFSSITNGSEAVKKIPALGFHGYANIDRYSLTLEWIGVVERFRTQDLSFDGRGARPQAAQAEAGVTFRAFDKPSSFAFGYQWSKDTLALNLPNQRLSGVFNISIWKDTVESLEYRHDIDFRKNQFANGASSSLLPNANTVSSGKSSDTVLAQIGVYF